MREGHTASVKCKASICECSNESKSGSFARSTTRLSKPLEAFLSLFAEAARRRMLRSWPAPRHSSNREFPVLCMGAMWFNTRTPPAWGCADGNRSRRSSSNRSRKISKLKHDHTTRIGIIGGGLMEREVASTRHWFFQRGKNQQLDSQQIANGRRAGPSSKHVCSPPHWIDAQKMNQRALDCVGGDRSTKAQLGPILLAVKRHLPGVG